MSKLISPQEHSRRPYESPSDIPAGVKIVAERLREAMADRGIDQSQLARAIGVTQGTISLILLGKTRRSKHMPEIASYLEVSLEWLAGRVSSKEEAGSEGEAFSRQELALVQRWRALPSNDRSTLERITEALSDTHDKGHSYAQNLPDEAAMARMFEGLLAAMPEGLDRAGCAQLLARWLPTGLSQLQDLLPDADPAPVVGEKELAEADATPGRAPRQ